MSSEVESVFPLHAGYQPINPRYPGLSIANSSPSIFVVDNFLSPEKCDLLIQSATPFMIPAPVVGAGNGEVSASRTSTTCFIAREDVPSVVNGVSELLMGKPVEHIELPQVGRYQAGEEYRAHYDSFDMETADGRRFASNGGQRVCTVLIYLNDVPTGGQTAFPLLRQAFQPKQGRALVFFPSKLNGEVDSQTLHGECFDMLALLINYFRYQFSRHACCGHQVCLPGKICVFFF